MDETASAASMATVDAVIVIGFLVLVTVVGFAMSKIASQGINDYFLGGKKIPWWILGVSSSTSNFDMAGTMVLVAMVFALGYKGFLVELRGGVGITLAFLMVFLGKWLRRSRVMTSAEWMKIRFGTDTQGQVAHILSAAANIILSVGMIIYFSKGGGKFLTHFIPLPELTIGGLTLAPETLATAIMVTVGLLYTLLSGLYGVVFTDVLQMIILSFTALFVTFHAFTIAPQVTLPEQFLTLNLESPGEMGEALSSPEMPLHLFGIAVVMWFFRSTLEGMGGVGGYTDQRFFAARTEREASLLTMESIVLSLLRWTMVSGLVVMGYHLVQKGAPGAEMIQNDPEQVLPVVLGTLLPAGVKGIVIAGLVAAAMSTFDSTLNAGASYLVRDVYQRYVNPAASGAQLVRMSHLSTVALCVVGIVLAAAVPNINTIWGFLTMGVGAGMFVPLFLRWYWPRFNGYGFAAGTATGLLAAVIVSQWGLDWPLHQGFPTVIGSAFLASVVVTLATPPIDDHRLVDFWMQINPWGLWGQYVRLARGRGLLTEEQRRDRATEKMNDALALCLAIPFQLALLLAGMSGVFHDWSKFSFFATIAAFCGVGLYFFWYRNLKSEAQCRAEDEEYERREQDVAAAVARSTADAS
jgi:Na+/proline symporter